MQYIVHRRFKNKAICGEVNLPAMTICESDGVIIAYEGHNICAVISENAHQYFARNDDGKGMERGFLTQAIQKQLARKDTLHQMRWDQVWADLICQKYKRIEYEDYWLWNHDFFNASVGDLQHIASLIGVKV